MGFRAEQAIRSGGVILATAMCVIAPVGHATHDPTVPSTYFPNVFQNYPGGIFGTEFGYKREYLGIFGAWQRDDCSNAGLGNPTLMVRPIDGLRIEGRYAEAFRAPNIAELFNPDEIDYVAIDLADSYLERQDPGGLVLPSGRSEFGPGQGVDCYGSDCPEPGTLTLPPTDCYGGDCSGSPSPGVTEPDPNVQDVFTVGGVITPRWVEERKSRLLEYRYRRRPSHTRRLHAIRWHGGRPWPVFFPDQRRRVTYGSGLGGAGSLQALPQSIDIPTDPAVHKRRRKRHRDGFQRGPRQHIFR